MSFLIQIQSYRGYDIWQLWLFDISQWGGGHQKKIQTHAYYYHQIKAQLQTTKYDYCDFFVMLVNDFCSRNPVKTLE